MIVKDDGKIRIFKTAKGWYRLYRQGQRSWEAVCIIPTKNPKYLHKEGTSFHGNATNVMDGIEVLEEHILPNEFHYRTALMSIAGTGKIGVKFNVKFLDEEL